MNDTTEILKSSRQLIEKREGWWDGSGDWWAQPAGTFCAVQAFEFMARLHYGIVGDYSASEECYGALLNALPPTTRRHGLTRYNNTHSHRSIVRLFDRAIAATEVNE